MTNILKELVTVVTKNIIDKLETMKGRRTTERESNRKSEKREIHECD